MDGDNLPQKLIKFLSVALVIWSGRYVGNNTISRRCASDIEKRS